MITTMLREKAVRSSFSLFAATMIASGALMIASVGALAGPPSPSVDIVDVLCDTAASGPPSTVVSFAADASYKGKWVDLAWTITLDGEEMAADMVDRWNSTRQYSNIDASFVSASNAEVTVAVLDRNGSVLLSDSMGEGCS